jgi:PKD repeat protein
MKKFLFGIVATLWILSSQAGNDILLRSGSVRTVPNFDQVIARNVPTGQVFAGRYYTYLQFSEIPLQALQDQINESGIHLLSYLPNKTYIASIPQAYDLRWLKPHVRAIIEIQPSYKIDLPLTEQPLPLHAITSPGQIRLLLNYYKDAPLLSVLSELTRHGYEILRYSNIGQWIEIDAPTKNIAQIAGLPFVSWVEAGSPPPVPDDEEGRSMHRSNVINNYFAGMRKYDGDGIGVLIGDDGIVGPHIDFTGRIDQSNAVNNGPIQHGDMVAGIVGGAGNVDPTIKGMATGAFLWIYDITSAPYNHINQLPSMMSSGARITSTSYSEVCGGAYTATARTSDQLTRQNPTTLQVFSAGNSASSNCGYGVSGYGNITGGHKAAKNVIAVANLNNKDVRDGSSSRGPAEDGRIKPDIASNGKDQMSTDPNHTYGPGGGTSAACPGIAGISAQLMQAYKDNYSGVEPEGALVKACMLNTAEDLGRAGPDFVFGWGRINALKAVRVIEDGTFIDSVVTQGDTVTHQFTVPANVANLRVMVYWMDHEAAGGAAKALVNDLDMLLTDPGTTPYQPWILNPTATTAALTTTAWRGTDTLNNMEQVTLSSPAAGTYEVRVTGTEVPMGPQRYYVIYYMDMPGPEVIYPIGGEGFVPGEQEILRWDAPKESGDFLLEYTVDNGSTWDTITTVTTSNRLYHTWTVPNQVTGDARIRVTRNGLSDISDTTFNIIGLPTNINIPVSCPDSMLITWTAVDSATAYEVLRLGSKYMDSVTTVTGTSAMIYQNSSVEQWVAVRALASGIRGRRSNATTKSAGTYACPLPVDGGIVSLLSPASSYFSDCIDVSATAVTIEVKNEGLDTIDNIPVAFQLNANPIIYDTVAGPLSSGQSTSFTFTATIDINSSGTHNLEVWAELSGDGNRYNDTVSLEITKSSFATETLPWTEDLETFSLCSVDLNCELTICPLANGLANMTNGAGDDIDWRTNRGTTASTGTGPSTDHKPGTALGNYIYLEASGGCTWQTARLVTPCFDLTNTTQPIFTFWYHMNGLEMGELHVDVLDGTIIDEDVISVTAGNQGAFWRQKTIDLSAYNGKQISVIIRGRTGSGVRSDMALDNFGFYDHGIPLVTDFVADNTNPCVDEPVKFTDLTANGPTSWSWLVDPPNHTFVNSTNNVSQHPEMEFSTSGDYEIKLVTNNPVGWDTLVKSLYIQVGNGQIPPVAEDFEGEFQPNKWKLIDVGGTHTWDTISGITGLSGASTTSAWINNFNYNNAGANDILQTPLLHLDQVIDPYLTFEVAYARQNGGGDDGLIISLTPDCGVTNTQVYNLAGAALETTPSVVGEFFPSAGNQWRTDTIDLNAYIGQTVRLRFTGDNQNGNNLFIDNVNLHGLFTSTPTLPTAEASVQVWPNPTTGQLNLSGPAWQDDEVQIEVTDLLGRIQFQTTVTTTTTGLNKQIDLGQLPGGFYHVRLSGQRGRTVIKIGLQ